MSNPLNGLKNAKIFGLLKVQDYWQMITDKGNISIYNPMEYRTAAGARLDLEQLRLGDIVDRIVVNVIDEDETQLCFELDGGSSVVISLAEEDYDGPEALCADLYSGVTVVMRAGDV